MKIITIFLLFVFVVACSPQIYVPTEKNVNKHEVATLTELKQGRYLYLNNCGKCHKLPRLNSRTNDKWKGVLEIMAPKAKLTEVQSDLVYLYIVNQ